jgi:hypothetical protein
MYHQAAARPVQVQGSNAGGLHHTYRLCSSSSSSSSLYQSLGALKPGVCGEDGNAGGINHTYRLFCSSSSNSRSSSTWQVASLGLPARIEHRGQQCGWAPQHSRALQQQQFVLQQCSASHQCQMHHQQLQVVRNNRVVPRIASEASHSTQGLQVHYQHEAAAKHYMHHSTHLCSRRYKHPLQETLPVAACPPATLQDAPPAATMNVCTT